LSKRRDPAFLSLAENKGRNMRSFNACAVAGAVRSDELGGDRRHMPYQPPMQPVPQPSVFPAPRLTCGPGFRLFGRRNQQLVSARAISGEQQQLKGDNVFTPATHQSGGMAFEQRPSSGSASAITITLAGLDLTGEYRGKANSTAASSTNTFTTKYHAANPNAGPRQWLSRARHLVVRHASSSARA